MAFLGDFGKFFGLGKSEEVLGDVGATVGSIFGPQGTFIGEQAGKAIGRATSNLAGDDGISPISTADQALEQSAVSVSPRGDVPQETANVGITGMTPTSDAFIGGFGNLLPTVSKFLPSASKFFSSPVGSIGTGVVTGVGINALTSNGMRKMKPVLTQSRRNKARVRQLANFVGIPGAAQFLSQASGKNVTEADVINLLLRTFRNDGAYITKAQVRNLRRTTNRFKTLEKQVKEATSMTRTTRRPAMRRASSTTLIKN